MLSTMNRLCGLLILVLSGYRIQAQDNTASQVQPNLGPEIYSLHVQTEVAFRFATTQVISRLANIATEAKEAIFAMTIPKNAFISSFVMTIDGVDYPGEVKEKVKAKIQYEKAKAKGESAGRVSAVQMRNTFQFRVAVNVAAQSKVDFNITYQELLERKHGFYEYVLNINPGQVVRDIRVDVFIRESREITEVRVPPIKHNATEVVDVTQINPDVQIMRDSRTSYHILYDPDESAQARGSSNGVTGQLIVQYDVARDQDAGEIQVIDGYFIHYFAPSGLIPVNKNVLFVIDVSGSMYGDKMRQTKDAMQTILDDLREGDMFNIITFSTYVSSWQTSVKEATPENIRAAKDYVTGIKADGGTNINDALLRGVTFLEEESAREWEKKPSMIIFLTDGEPTSGITSLSRIMSNIRQQNQGRYTIFSLGFGHDLDFHFLQKISLQNRGLARRIYQDSDATLQLEGFYNEVSTPVLSEIEISYIGDVVEPGSITEIEFPAFYKGGEIVVAGKLKDGIKNLDSRVAGHASQGYMAFDTNVRIPKAEKDALQIAYSNITERLWAYMTIKKLLDKMLESANATERAAAKKKALELSLKYSFVTPLTSMVVTKPEEPQKNIGNLEDSEEEQESKQPPASHSNKRKQSSPSSPRRHQRRPSFVDNDPHFIIHVQGMEDAVCFNVDGPSGLVYQLLHDRVSETVVNGRVTGKKLIPVGHKYPRTYIGELMIMHHGLSIYITPYKIVLKNKDKSVYQWRKSIEINQENVKIFIEAKRKVIINLGDNIVIVVLRHLVDPSHSSKVDFLGMYVVDSDGLSEYSHGLLGQFLHQTASIHNITSSQRDQAELHIQGPHTSHRKVSVKQIRRRDMDRKDYVSCWNARNNGHGLLAGKHTDYVVPALNHTKNALKHYKISYKLFHPKNHPNRST